MSRTDRVGGSAASVERLMWQVDAKRRRSLALPWSVLIRHKLGNAFARMCGRRVHGQGLIGASAQSVQGGFAGLAQDGFSHYNLPQVWVERRALPQALHDRVPLHDASILDIGCGIGDSTWILSQCGNASWRITGIDLEPGLIRIAEARAAAGEFRGRDGGVVKTAFGVADISAADLPDHPKLRGNTFNFAVSCGVVGLYLDAARARQLLCSLRVMLAPGSFAAIDCGPSVPRWTMQRTAESLGFTFHGLVRSVPLDPRPKLLLQSGGPRS